MLWVMLYQASPNAGWEQVMGAAVGHVEGWPSHLGSFSLEVLGGTGAFPCSLLCYRGCLRAGCCLYG